jgi:hypothetical protein
VIDLSNVSVVLIPEVSVMIVAKPTNGHHRDIIPLSLILTIYIHLNRFLPSPTLTSCTEVL